VRGMLPTGVNQAGNRVLEPHRPSMTRRCMRTTRLRPNTDGSKHAFDRSRTEARPHRECHCRQPCLRPERPQGLPRPRGRRSFRLPPRCRVRRAGSRDLIPAGTNGSTGPALTPTQQCRRPCSLRSSQASIRLAGYPVGEDGAVEEVLGAPGVPADGLPSRKPSASARSRDLMPGSSSRRRCRMPSSRPCRSPSPGMC
jgi:hypothetical protein